MDFAGANHALAKIKDESTKKRYRSLVRNNLVSWWKPKSIWAQLPDVIRALLDPFAEDAD